MKENGSTYHLCLGVIWPERLKFQLRHHPEAAGALIERLSLSPKAAGALIE